MTKTIRLAVAFTLVAAAAAVRAQGVSEIASPYYISGRIGVFSPQHSDIDGFKTGFAGEIALGRRFLPNVAAELGVGHYRSHYEQTFYDPTTGMTQGVKGDLSVTPLTATAKVILPAGALEPYALVGAGLYMADLSAEASGFVSGSGSDSDTTFGYHLGAGASLAVSGAVSVGLEFRYLWVTPKFAGQSVGTDGYQITGGAAFRF